MRILIIAAGIAGLALPTAAMADSPRREYREDVRDAQRDYHRDMRRADSRRDVREARRDYNREIREARREYRRDTRGRYYYMDRGRRHYRGW